MSLLKYVSNWKWNVKNEKEEIVIYCNDLMFLCSTGSNLPSYLKNENNLFCFSILNNPMIDEKPKNTMELDVNFEIIIGANQYSSFHYIEFDSVQTIKDKLKQEFELNNKIEENKKNNINKIKIEEKLLSSEEKTLQQKKTIKTISLKAHKKGEGVLIFEVIENLKNNRDFNVNDQSF